MPKQKLSIADKIGRTKYHIPYRFFWFIYRIAAKLVCFFNGYKINYKVIDDIRDCKGPCFLIWNHLSRRDYLFLIGLCKSRSFNIVCEYNEFFRKKFVFPFWFAQVLPKKNFVPDYHGLKSMLSIIKQGGCVAFSPEGMSSIYGHNQPIVPGTGKFFKQVNIPIYFVKLEGAYLMSHKVDIKDRVGQINATMSLMYSPEDLKSKTGEQIEDEINLAFKHDDYIWNKTSRNKYKTKNDACSHLNDLLYRCPKCGSELTIESKGDTIKCTHCGNGATLDDYYDFHPFDKECVIPESPSIWFDDQRKEIIKEIRNNDNYSYTFDVKMSELPKHKVIKDKEKIAIECGKGKMKIDHQGIHFDGVKNNEAFSFTLKYDVYYSLIISNDCTNFSFFVDEEYYMFEPLKPLTGKVLLLVEEMHRLHVNIWKNFPWFNELYLEDNK